VRVDAEIIGVRAKRPPVRAETWQVRAKAGKHAGKLMNTLFMEDGIGIFQVPFL